MGKEVTSDVIRPDCIPVGDFVVETRVSGLVWLRSSVFVAADDGPFEATGAVKKDAAIEIVALDRVMAVDMDSALIDVGSFKEAAVTAVCDEPEARLGGSGNLARVAAAISDDTASTTTALNEMSSSTFGIDSAAAATTRFEELSSGSEVSSADAMGIVLLVPRTENAATSVPGAITGFLVGLVNEGGSEGRDDSAVVFVRVCDVCGSATGGVISVEATVSLSVTSVDEATVRIRDRVHRLPFTVVTDS